MAALAKSNLRGAHILNVLNCTISSLRLNIPMWVRVRFCIARTFQKHNY
jgi:hypothetical protein